MLFFEGYRANPYLEVPAGWIVYVAPQHLWEGWELKEVNVVLLGDRIWARGPEYHIDGFGYGYNACWLAGIDPNGIKAAEYHQHNIKECASIARWVTRKEVDAFIKTMYGDGAVNMEYETKTYYLSGANYEAAEMWKYSLHPMCFSGYYLHKSEWEE